MPNDIATASNGRNMLIASDILYPAVRNYASVFADKEEVNGQILYSRVGLSLLAIGGSKEYVRFYLDVDQCEYLYLLSKDFHDIHYESVKESTNNNTRSLEINRNSFYKDKPTTYPWYIAIRENGKQMSINLTDEQFFSIMSRIHRWIALVANHYAGYIMSKKFEFEHGTKN